MSHSQYYPSSNVIKVENPPVVTAPVPSYHAPYTVSHYPTYNYHHHQVYNNNNNNNNNVGDFYQKDFGYQQNYQQQQQPPSYSSLTLTPPLASPTIIHNFDQLSNCSPPSAVTANTSDYIFNGDFGIFSSSDFDLSFPFVDSTITTTTTATAAAVKPSSQLFDNQTVEIKQLTPIKIQSLDDDDVEKKCFELASDDHDDDAIPALPSVASVNCWKFTEPQMAASY